ncbi:MAG TPA: COX15/CtaA family protein [Acidobacteriaceae bacterium]|jgi:cytochrome c oxidase assembly protein subunit 15|nr:COX15/CtaA family protein [Acidobacteriaceae bacterium]
MPIRNNWLRNLAWTTLGWNVLVILWGAVVRATHSGAGCGNNWPLCNGEVIPVSPRVDTIIEFTHRMMTGGATILVLALLIGVLVGTEKGRHSYRGARIAAWITTLLLINEAFLGYLLVTLGYVTTNRSFGRVVVLSIHLSNTLLLLAALTVTAALLTRDVAQPRITASLKTLWWAAAGLAATMLVGVSGSLAALGDTLFPSATLAQSFAQDFSATAPLLLRLRWVHPAAACVAAVFVGWLVVHAKGGRAQGRLRWLVVTLLGVQFLLGIADVLLLAPVWMQILHLFGADLYWIALVLLLLSLLLDETPEPVSASNPL